MVLQTEWILTLYLETADSAYKLLETIKLGQ